MIQRMVLGGTDGFRGEAQLDNPDMGIMNGRTVGALSAALVEYQQDLGIDGPVVIARDTRPSSPELYRAAVHGVLSRGADIIGLDIAPTPMAQRVADLERAAATIVITASHNPHAFNGRKGMLGSAKPTGDQQRAISDLAWDLALTQQYGDLPDASDSDESMARKYTETYIQSVVDDISGQFGEKPLAGKMLIVDGSSGAAQMITPVILRRLGAEVHEFACDGSGLINEGCGAADLRGVKQYLMERPELMADPNFLGAVANDGDADRMMAVGVMTDSGEPRLVELDGNHTMWMLSKAPGMVGTDYTNKGLVHALQASGIEFEYCANGDSNVTQALRRRQAAGEPWTRGGEFTGHIVDTDWLGSGDGIRTGALFAATIATHSMSFGDVYAGLPLWQQRMRNVKTYGLDGHAIMSDSRYLEAVERAEAKLGGLGRLLLRASGTEPLFRVWGEAEDGRLLERVVGELVHVVNEVIVDDPSMSWLAEGQRQAI